MKKRKTHSADFKAKVAQTKQIGNASAGSLNGYEEYLESALKEYCTEILLKTKEQYKNIK